MGEATTTSPPRISELLLNSSQAQVEMGSRALPASMPPQPPHNIRIYHSIALTDVSLEEAYDKLARVDGMEAVVKLGAAAQRCDVEPVEYSTEYHDPADLQTPYNLDFTSPAMGAHLRRARFYLVEHLDYKIMAVDAKLFGSQTELVQPDFASGVVTALYATYESSKKIWVRKTRTLSRQPDREGHSVTKVAETLQITCPGLLRPIVKRAARKGHKKHMLQYGRLFSGTKVKVALLEGNKRR